MKTILCNKAVCVLSDIIRYHISNANVWRHRLYEFVGLIAMLVFFCAKVNAATTIFTDLLPHNLKTYYVNSSGLEVTVSLQPCKDGKCGIFLNLLKNKKIIDTIKLKWPLPAYQENPNVARPLSVSINEKVKSNEISSFNLTVGDHEANSIDVDLKIIKFKNDKFSIFIVQTAGFESTAENYELYSLNRERFEKKFQSTANTAVQQSSSYEIVDVDDDGFENIVSVNIWRIAGLQEGGDSKSFNMYPPPVKVEYYAVILETSPDLGAVIKKRTVLEDKYSCLKYKTLVLNTSDYKSLKPNLYIMGDVVIGKKAALALLKKYKDCANVSDAYMRRAK